MLEKEIEAYFVKSVKSLGGIAYKFNSLSNRGVSDRIAMFANGIVVMVELKRPGGKLSRLQELFAEDMQKLGVAYACLWSKDDVDVWINNIKTDSRFVHIQEQ